MTCKRKTISSGFTLVEIMIVIGIGAILTASAIPAFGNIQAGSLENDVSARLVQTLRMAREKAVSGEGGENHGIFFDVSDEANDRYVLYRGNSFVARDSAYDREEIIPETIDISTDFVGNDINFSLGSGLPGINGQITVSADYRDQRIFSVNRLGFVREE